MRKLNVVILLGLAWLLFFSSAAQRFQPHPGAARAQAGLAIQLEPLLSGLSSPVYVTHARDGSRRLFIVEQPGQIKVLQPGSNSPTVFLNLAAKLVAGGERGLLGLAFHPQFKTNRRFFVNYTRQSDGATVIAEYRASASDPHTADTAETVLLTIAQPFANHNGGMIEFGPDGLLYIGLGDGGSGNDPGNRAQNTQDLLGKMLRINVDQPNGAIPYSSPPTNPFFGADPGRDEIYAVGLRNPWRFSFDRVTGELYAGDVGQTQREEVSLIRLGGNYGWRVLEGTRCTGLGPAACTAPGFTPPIVEYDHSGGRCSVTGGYVYRGARGSLPVGAYVYGDYCSGEIFLWNNNTQTLLLDTSINIASFGEDETGEIYVVGLSGTVHRIVNANANLANTSAASFNGGTLGRESIATAFGTALAGSTQTAATTPLPTTLGSTRVTIRDSAGNDHPAALFFVSPTQVNYHLPPQAAIGQATVTITNGATSATGLVQILPVAPGLFAANANGQGIAAALVQRVRADNSQSFEPVAQFNAGQNQFTALPIDLGPATDQVFLVLFGTGIRFRSSLAAVTARIDGAEAEVLFAGAQPDFIGLDQVNVRLSRSLIGRGEVEVVLTVDGQISNVVRIHIL
jgi:uncharacterized protein (TIGR03437 family)